MWSSSAQGDTLIYSYISKLGAFLGFKISNFNILFFFFFRKMNIFGTMKILWMFSWGHHKTGLVLGVISMHFMFFS